MRKEFIPIAKIIDLMVGMECSEWCALDMLVPWACRTQRVEGGYVAFESADEYDTWKNQK